MRYRIPAPPAVTAIPAPAVGVVPDVLTRMKSDSYTVFAVTVIAFSVADAHWMIVMAVSV